MMPVIAWNALHASTILREAMDALRARDASTASRPTTARARELLDRSTATATALSPYIGYAATAEIAKEVGPDRPIDSRARARARPARRDEQLDEILSVEAMTRGGHRRTRTKAGEPGQADWRHRTACAARGVLALPVRSVCPPAFVGTSRRPRSVHPAPARSIASSRRRISACSKRPIATSGRSPTRSWTRSASPTAPSSPTSAPAAAGSRSGWRAASARTASSTPKTSSR